MNHQLHWLLPVKDHNVISQYHLTHSFIVLIHSNLVWFWTAWLCIHFCFCFFVGFFSALEYLVHEARLKRHVNDYNSVLTFALTQKSAKHESLSEHLLCSGPVKSSLFVLSFGSIYKMVFNKSFASTSRMTSSSTGPTPSANAVFHISEWACVHTAGAY